MAQPILIVDDSEDDVVLLKMVLKTVGLINPIRVLNGGGAAIEYLGGEGEFRDRSQYPMPILLMLDLCMSPVGGFDVLRKLQHLDRDGIAVVMMTGARERTQVGEAYRLGADSFLTKPIHALDLHYTLEGLKGLILEDKKGGLELSRRSPVVT